MHLVAAVHRQVRERDRDGGMWRGQRLTRLEEEVKGLRNARKAAQSSWKLLAQALVAACAIAALILQVVHH